MQQVLIVGAGCRAIALGAALGRLGIPYHDRRKERRYRRHLVRQSLSRLRRRHAEPLLFVLLRTRATVEPLFLAREEILDYLKTDAREDGVGEHPLRTRLLSARFDEGRRRWISLVEDPAGRRADRERPYSSAPSASSMTRDRGGHQGQESFSAVRHSIPRCGRTSSSSRARTWRSSAPAPPRCSSCRPSPIGCDGQRLSAQPTMGAADRRLFRRDHRRRAMAARTPALLCRMVPLQHVLALWRRLLPFLRKDPDWPHPDRAVNKGNDRHREELTDFILSELKDRPDLIEKCVPTYPPYGKRILLDNDWYKTLTKPNVELVTDRIDNRARRHRNGGRQIASGGHHRDLHRLQGHGDGGAAQHHRARRQEAEAGLGQRQSDRLSRPYRAGFSEPVLMLGPNSGPAHGGSVIFQSECQSRYISACLVEMIEQGIAAIEVRPEAHDEYIRQVDAEHEQLIWTHPGMTTYYRNRQGRVFSAMPWRFVDYWAMTHDPDLGQYRLKRSDFVRWRNSVPECALVLDTARYLPQHLRCCAFRSCGARGSPPPGIEVRSYDRALGSGCGQTSAGPLLERSMTPPAQTSDLAQRRVPALGEEQLFAHCAV